MTSGEGFRLGPREKGEDLGPGGGSGWGPGLGGQAGVPG